MESCIGFREMYLSKVGFWKLGVSIELAPGGVGASRKRSLNLYRNTHNLVSSVRPSNNPTRLVRSGRSFLPRDLKDLQCTGKRAKTCLCTGAHRSTSGALDSRLTDHELTAYPRIGTIPDGGQFRGGFVIPAYRNMARYSTSVCVVLFRGKRQSANKPIP